MPVDTSIYSQIQPVKFESPLNMLAQVSQVKALQNQNRLADLAYGQKQQEISDANGLRGVLSDRANYGVDGILASDALPKIGAAAPGQYGTYAKQMTEQKTAVLTQQRAALDNHLKTLDVVSRDLGPTLQNPALYPQVKASLAQLSPEGAANLPEQFDPAAIQAIINKALTEKDKIAIHQKEIDQQLAAAKFGYQQQNDAANRSVTLRGQNMTDARAREATAQGKVPAGYRQNPDGSLVFIPGGPADPNVKTAGRQPTEFQGKSAAFGARAEDADRIIGELAGKYSPAAINSKNSVESTPVIGGILGAVTNATALSPTDQRAEQAQRDFVNAVLRQESGAAIASSEFDNAKKQYFPQPGDSKEVIAQKARNRKIAIQGFKNSAGSAAFSAPPDASAIPSGWTVQEH